MFIGPVLLRVVSKYLSGYQVPFIDQIQLERVGASLIVMLVTSVELLILKKKSFSSTTAPSPFPVLEETAIFLAVNATESGYLGENDYEIRIPPHQTSILD